MTDELDDHLHCAILARGYVQIATHESPEAFGSWYRDYELAGQTVRLIWDGRDQWYVLQGGPTWHDLAIRRPAELKANGLEAFVNHLSAPRE